MFYNRIEIINKITLKLKSNYNKFKEWAINCWLHTLIKIAVNNDFEIFLVKPIENLNISKKLKTILKKFGVNTIKEIIETYTEKDFRDGEIFKNILKFQGTLHNQKTIYQYVKKEVTTR